MLIGAPQRHEMQVREERRVRWVGLADKVGKQGRSFVAEVQ